MNTTRWDPWSELLTLREAMNNLLEEGVVRPRGRSVGAISGLTVDVREQPDRFVVTASVPGVDPDDVEISILGDALRIRGERHGETDATTDGGRWLVRERRFGAFERTVSLPGLVRADAAAADFGNGVLTVMLPKAERGGARTIPVRARGASQKNAIEVKADASPESYAGDPVRQDA